VKLNGIFVPAGAGPESARPTCDECGKEVDGVHVIRTADETPRLTLCVPCLRTLYDNVIALLRK
jgi:hypothetical protein